jgi:hypothetical protein
VFIEHQIPAGQIELDKKWTLLTVRLPEAIKPQTARFQFSYTGELNDIMHGFSRFSNYYNFFLLIDL